MSTGEEEIPQIKPQSILDPPQIKLDDGELDRGSVEEPEEKDEKREDEPKVEMKKSKLKQGFKFKKPHIGKPHIKLRNKKVAFGVGGAILGVIFLLLILVVVPGISLYRSGNKLVGSAHALKDSMQSQDIAVVKSSLSDFRNNFSDFQGNYQRFAWSGHLPIVGPYWRDGDSALKAGNEALDAADVIVKTIEPYADIIGFGGPDSQNTGDTANDRIQFLIQTIDSILPNIDEIAGHAKAANNYLASIDPSRYPENFRGVAVRDQLTKALDTAKEASSFVANSKPLLEQAPYLLGTDSTRTYLLLFQNDKELRPTGGFMTAYSIIQVENGKIHPVSSNDIYNLDSKYKPSIEAPQILRDYLKGPYLISKDYRLRDMNWSPDFKQSMDLFTAEAAKAGIKDIDGVIAVDTQVVVNILNAIGPVDVPGYGQYSTNHDERCDCPQVIYELESFADVEGPVVWSENEPGKIVFAPPNYLNRKEIVGPLMNSILSNALGQPKDKLPDLFQAGFNSLLQKHILLYMFDENAQKGVEAFGIGGELKSYDGDYLMIADANLGGRKSNLYVTQEVVQDIEVAGDGTVTKTLTINYQNPKDYDGWLNSVMPNWTRIYLPKGSEVVSTDGFEKDGGTYDELDKTVVAGGFDLRPQGIKKITVKYKLPMKMKGEYKMLIQKQPGKDQPLYTINVGKHTDEFYLKTDNEYTTKI